MRSRLARAITALALASLGGCIKAPPGGLCGSDGDCGEGYRCTDDAHGGARCMGRCAAGIGLCSDGSVCLTPPASTELVCWFGGRIPIDDPCDSTIDCEPGTVCSLGRCRQACQIGLPPGVDAGPAGEPDAGPGAGPCTVSQGCFTLDPAIPELGICRPYPPSAP
jgi:hypothetical protein